MTWKLYFVQCRDNSLVRFSSVAQSCPTFCDPMNHSTPGLPVHHQLPEFTQTHVHQVSNAIQPSHPLSSPSPPAPNPSQHQSLFPNESTLHMRWPKYWSFSFSIIPLETGMLPKSAETGETSASSLIVPDQDREFSCLTYHYCLFACAM